MNIHIFGHSVCYRATKRDPIPTFTDMLAEKYNIPDEHILATTFSSEERLLYYLKKSKNVDLAIIFHSLPGSLFVPTISRDFGEKMKTNTESDLWTKKYFDNRVQYFENPDSKNAEPSDLDFEEFKTAYSLYLKYFVTPDLIKNRYYGALIQIDQYLTYKKIPAIHCVLKECVPAWFTFSSGIVDLDLAEPGNHRGPYACSNQHTVNSVTPTGNRHIFNKLVEYIDDLRRV